MKRSRTTKTILIAGLVLFTGAAIAFAHGGGYGGYGGYGGNGCGYGGDGNMRGYGGYGHHRMDTPGFGRNMGDCANWRDLSDEDRAKLEAVRDKFHSETQELRGQIDEKAVALRNELVKENPDDGKVTKLQKELSGLKAAYDLQAIQFRLEMRKIAPEGFKGRGYGGGYGRGQGRGQGRGYCW